MGISRQHLSGIVNGHQAVSRNVLRKAEEAFGLQPRWVQAGLGPFRIAEDGPEYATTPGPRPEVHTAAAPVIGRQVWQCGYCYAEIRQYVERCHRCGSRIDWSRQVSAGLADTQEEKGEGA